ncbi:MAG TPA: FAD-dependent oxidoreductase [Dehalococcoidia bacterium]|nr:FAD-dependent oxidoreductase [Dehalococcoidia bacterium]
MVGAGIMGAATARAVARHGANVLLVEQFGVGHERGSSHGTSRIFRFSYPHELYVQLAMKTLPLWRDLERESGRALLTVTGGLDRGEHITAHAAALQACAAKYEVIKGSEAASRFPGLRLPADEPVLYQPDAGYLAADAALNAMVDSAVAHGAELREESRVQTIEPDGNDVGLRLLGGRVSARSVVITAGAWAGKLLQPLAIDLPLRPTRETVAFFRFDGELPPLVEWGTPSIYSLPAPQVGLKVGEHQAGPTIDPDVDGGPDEASLRRLTAWVRERFPAADPAPEEVQTCLYTNTPDDSFILERFGAIVVGSPCSGHGFKFAPLIGERLAELALGG